MRWKTGRIGKYPNHFSGVFSESAVVRFAQLAMTDPQNAHGRRPQ
jgi:hypothetical protein